MRFVNYIPYNRVIILLVILSFVLFSTGCSISNKNENNANGDNAKQEVMNMYATIETNLGTIKIQLDKEKAPISVENFRNYAESGFYGNTIFHRVIPGFMIQGGGFTSDGKQKETLASIKNEAKNGLLNKRGAIAMARTNVVDSATSQFFINLADNDFLNYKDDVNYGYAVFGKVVEGMAVVDKIAQVPTESKSPYFDDWPVEDVVIKKISIAER